MNIPIINKQCIEIDKLKRVDMLGINPHGTPVQVFCKTIPTQVILDSAFIEVPDELLQQVHHVQFKYVHHGSIKMGNWYKKSSMPRIATTAASTPTYTPLVTYRETFVIDDHLRGDFSFDDIKNIPAYIINLDRHPERYTTAKHCLTSTGFTNITRWSAPDGSLMNPQHQLEELGILDFSRFNNLGEQGCALAHMQVLKDMLASKDQYRLIFEDDIIVHSKFHQLFESLKHLSLDSFDVLFLGGWFWSYADGKQEFRSKHQAVAYNNQQPYIHNAVNFETHAMLVTRKFAHKALTSYRNWTGRMALDNFYTQSKYFDTCLLTFDPFDSNNIEQIQLRNTNSCGLFYQSNLTTSSIQDVNNTIIGPKEVSIQHSGGQWTELESYVLYEYKNVKVYGVTTIDTSPVMPATGVLMLNNGIIANCGSTMTQDHKLVNELSWYGDAKTRPLNVWESFCSSHTRATKFKTNDIKKLPGKCLNLFSTWANSNPGHYQLDTISKWSVVMQLNQFKLQDFDWVCLPDASYKLAKIFVEKLNIDPEKIIYISRDNQQAYQFDQLHSPTINGCSKLYRIKAFDPLCKLLNIKRRKPSKLLYVSREDSGRNIDNLQQVEDLLDKFGFEKVTCGADTNYIELIEKFSQASMVVGAHGAGLSNIMFCQPKTVMIEFVPEFHQQPYYMSLAHSVGLDYHGMICKDSGKQVNDVNSKSVNAKKSFVVDISLFAEIFLSKFVKHSNQSQLQLFHKILTPFLQPL